MPGLTSLLGRRRTPVVAAAAALTTLAGASRAEEDEEKDETAGDENDEQQANEPVEDDTDEPAGKGKRGKAKSGKGKKADDEEAPNEEPAASADEDDDEEYAQAAARDAVAEERKRVSQLNAFFSDRDPKFGQKAIDAGWSLKDSKARWADTVKPASKSARGSGNRPVGSNDADDEGDSGEDFNADEHPFMKAVNAKMAGSKGMKREKAVAAVVRENPDLQSAYIEDTNAAYKRNHPARR